MLRHGWQFVSSVVHANSPNNRYKVHLDDLHYRNRKFNNFNAYGEVKVASVQYAMELADRLKDTGVTTYSLHPGWARSNFGKGGNLLMRMLMTIARPLDLLYFKQQLGVGPGIATLPIV